MNNNKYLNTGLAVLSGLLLSSTLAMAKLPYDAKDDSAKEAKTNCLSMRGVFLENNYVATCVTQDGTFGARDEMLGMTFNPEGTGTVTTPDFLRPGSAFEFFSVTFNGQNFSNTNTRGEEINTDVLSGQNGGAMAYSTIQGHDGSRLQIIQKYTVDPNSKEIVVRVEMKNIGRRDIQNLHYARGIDPNQDVNISGSSETLNAQGGSFGGLNTSMNNIVHATGAQSNLALALYSVDPQKHHTCISDELIQNAEAIYSGDGCSEELPANYDATINLGFKLGNLRPRETKIFSFKYLFDKEKWPVLEV